MVDSGNKQQPAGEPLENCEIGHDYAGRNLFLYGLFFLCVATAFVVLDFVTLLFLPSVYLGCVGCGISIGCAGISLFFLIIVVWCGVYRRRHVVCLFWAIFVILLSWLAMPKFESYMARKQSARTEQTILQLVSEIESLRLQMNRLPENQEELVKLRGKAMPLSGWRTTLEYFKDPNESEYIIRAYTGSYFWGVRYSSRNPDAGVVPYYY